MDEIPSNSLVVCYINGKTAEVNFHLCPVQSPVALYNYVVSFKDLMFQLNVSNNSGHLQLGNEYFLDLVTIFRKRFSISAQNYYIDARQSATCVPSVTLTDGVTLRLEKVTLEAKATIIKATKNYRKYRTNEQCRTTL